MTANHIGQDFLAEHSLGELAEKLKVTDRQMRRVFREEFGVSPVEFWQTQRLLLAKQLLTDSQLTVTSVALASGFQSLRRFNALLKARYRMSPTELRKQRGERAPEDFADFAFRLSYRPPLDWERLLGFLARRAIPHVEEVCEGVYFRTVRVSRQDREFAGEVQVRHEAGKHLLAVRLSDALLPVCGTVLERVKRLFDLQADPAIIGAALGTLAENNPGIRVPGSFDGFETTVRAVLGQQISVAAAQNMAGRVALRFGASLSLPGRPLNRVFPTAPQIAKAVVADLLKLGITRRRAETLIALARAVAGGELVLEPGGRVEETLDRLRKIPGIGEWTTQYVAMRALAWPDGFPVGDLGIKKALGETNLGKIREMAEKWRPWRAYAALHLWTSLEKTL
jgi:AraC family transcriptional regulator of adaptative response / DNA-3-methyladenine glycosylase II